MVEKIIESWVDSIWIFFHSRYIISIGFWRMKNQIDKKDKFCKIQASYWLVSIQFSYRRSKAFQSNFFGKNFSDTAAVAAKHIWLQFESQQCFLRRVLCVFVLVFFWLLFPSIGSRNKRSSFPGNWSNDKIIIIIMSISSSSSSSILRPIMTRHSSTTTTCRRSSSSTMKNLPTILDMVKERSLHFSEFLTNRLYFATVSEMNLNFFLKKSDSNVSFLHFDKELLYTP